ncbi:MAG: FAD-dependent oxidoreductase [Lachnospiraceae bacterium]|nr:FAD-dependent oxidoreductase [Lachnospiraceae bacterium]
MREVRSLIIGAGVSGLSYGSRCKGAYLIVEKEKVPGGLCRTFHQDGYIWDYAGHFFHFATQEMREYFETRISKEEMVCCKKNTKIFYKGQYIDYPFQKNIHQLPKQEFIDCLYDLHFRKQQDVYINFETMLYGKFGKSITEKFLKPYNEKLYACDLNTLDADAMGRFFPYASETEIIGNMRQSSGKSYNDMFEYPKDGAQKFIDVLLEDIDENKLLLGVSVQQIDKDKRIAVLSNGERVKYQYLINTMPLDKFVDMCFPEEQKKGYTIFSANKVVVFNLGFDRESDVKGIHWVYYPEGEYCFYRVGFYNHILGTNRMSLYVELGCDTDDNINENEMLNRVLKDLKKCGIVSGQQLQSYNCLEMNPAYVHITEKSNQYVKEIFRRMESYGIFSVGRYGGWQYCSIEDCMVEATALARRL